MKKTFLTAIVALAALVALPAAAQNVEATSGATKTEQTAKKDKKDRREGVRPERKGHERMKNAFEGITLTDAQKEALKNLRSGKPECCKEEKACCKEEKACCDANEKAECKARPDHKKMRAEYIKGVKEILTPEQYVVFLENIAVNDAANPRPDRQNMHKKRPERKGDKERPARKDDKASKSE